MADGALSGNIAAAMTALRPWFRAIYRLTQTKLRPDRNDSTPPLGQRADGAIALSVPEVG